MAKSSGVGHEPYSGALLWIHHDADNLNSMVHMPQILKHVQKRYQPWRRRQKTEALFAWINARTRQRHAADQDEHKRHRKQANKPSPLAILEKGNSDPFAVYSINIGPKENELIALYRDYMIPSAYSSELGQKHMNTLAAQDLSDSLVALDDEGTALGTMARYGSIASRWNPEMRRVALKYLVQSIALLRKKITSGHDLQTSRDCKHVNMLFAAETIAGSLPGAVVHGNMLLQILQRQWRQGKLDYKLLIYQLFIDYQLSSMFVKRMIFDVDEWLPTVFQSMWDAAALLTPRYPTKALDASITDPWLRSSFELKQQQLHFMAARAETLDGMSHLELVWSAQMTQGMLFHSRMIDYYLTTKRRLKNELNLTQDEREELIAQSYLALAAAQLDRHIGGHPKLMKVPVYDTSRMTLALQRALLEQRGTRTEPVSSPSPPGPSISSSSSQQNKSSRCRDDRSGDKYANARLWALYVGAIVETSAAATCANPSGRWFNTALAAQARTLRIASWSACRDILREFLFYEGPFYVTKPACFDSEEFSN